MRDTVAQVSVEGDKPPLLSCVIQMALEAPALEPGLLDVLSCVGLVGEHIAGPAVRGGGEAALAWRMPA
jgi:hypothetical protein